MRSFIGTIVLAVVLASPLAAQQRAPGSTPPIPGSSHARSGTQAKSLAPVLPSLQSYKPESDKAQQLRTAAGADRDLTSEKIAILAIAVVLVVVIVRSVS